MSAEGESTIAKNERAVQLQAGREKGQGASAGQERADGGAAVWERGRELPRGREPRDTGRAKHARPEAGHAHGRSGRR